MEEHETRAYDRCPRCKSSRIEATAPMYGEFKWAVEHLVCNRCGLEFEQHYKYASTVGRWDDGKEGETWETETRDATSSSC